MKLLDPDWITSASPRKIRRVAQRRILIGDALSLVIAAVFLLLVLGWLFR